MGIPVEKTWRPNLKPENLHKFDSQFSGFNGGGDWNTHPTLRNSPEGNHFTFYSF